MLVHRRVTPSSMSRVPILYTWVERVNVGKSFLSKERRRWQGLGVEPPTFRSEVQCANYYTTAPPRRRKKSSFNVVAIHVHCETRASASTKGKNLFVDRGKMKHGRALVSQNVGIFADKLCAMRNKMRMNNCC